MAEKRKLKKKGQSNAESAMDKDLKPAKIEYDVGNYMKKHVPTKRTKFLSHPVNYFSANKAIDVLLDSPWATGENLLFTDRESVVTFCNKLLEHKFFHRAKKIAITDKDLSVKELKKKQEKKKLDQKKKAELEALKEEGKVSTNEDVPSSPKKDKDKDSKKTKTKIKLDMHLDQVFVDGSEAYVWMYDPIPFWYYIVGGLLLFAAVAICLFPLWPPMVRQGVYYLSIAAASFLGFILGLAVVKIIIFAFLWVLSLGRHHLWILPNLTEDVGFFESFWPLYHYEYRGGDYDRSKSKKKKSKETTKKPNSPKSSREDKGSQSNGDSEKLETDAERNGNVSAPPNGLTESEGSDSQNFEMLDRDELSVQDGDSQDQEQDSQDQEQYSQDQEQDSQDQEERD